ncbi:hypothetical protein [Streptomyces sp. YIM S03343]
MHLPIDPSPEEIRAILAERALNLRIRESIELGARRAAMRAIRQTPPDEPETDTN